MQRRSGYSAGNKRPDQKSHDAYFVYIRSTGSPIRFAGVERISPFQYGETGICLGDGYRGKGYGKQVLQCLLAYCREELGAKEFIYTAREEHNVRINSHEKHRR